MIKETSFSRKLQDGWTEEKLRQYYALSKDQYDRIIVCLQEIETRRTLKQKENRVKGGGC